MPKNDPRGLSETGELTTLEDLIEFASAEIPQGTKNEEGYLIARPPKNEVRLACMPCRTPY